MILDFKILSLWFVIEDWWYNTLTREKKWFLNVLVKSNFATPTLFGSVTCFVVGICLSNYNLNSFLIHQASYSKGYQRYFMHRENLGSIWKIGRYPIKVSEVLDKNGYNQMISYWPSDRTYASCAGPRQYSWFGPVFWPMRNYTNTAIFVCIVARSAFCNIPDIFYPNWHLYKLLILNQNTFRVVISLYCIACYTLIYKKWGNHT